ncbi:MAG: KH domain-containing protein [Leptospiraceae bacterium]|nr:KH domain-containing protein [Leptospiraceae bacterium]MDW8306251.1 RNA-binding cell elongation regulator Jag/EloR [Leptospiraceae bacterium]
MIILKTYARNEKEATELSCRYLGATPEQIEIVVHRKGSSGFLGFGPKKPGIYHILAKPKLTPLPVIAKGVISTIVHDMGYRVKFLKMERLEDGKFYVELSSQHAGAIIGKSGKTLEALQFLVNLIVEKIIQEPPKILLDIENYRARRANHLRELARRTAEYVIRTGRSRLLDPLNPYERRIIHLTLQDDTRVMTISEGDGVYKRIRICRREEGVSQEDTQKPAADSLAESDDLTENFDADSDEEGEFQGFTEESQEDKDEINPQ